MNDLPDWCVVDTNVAIVANGRSEQASSQLVEKCIDVLLMLTRKSGLVLDDGGEIFDEYRRNLCLSGQPGTGDMFLKWVHDHQWNSERCERRSITFLPNDPRGYAEFPLAEALARFDASDRKFVAVSCANQPKRPILESVDFKWWGWREALQAEGVQVLFIDEEEGQRGHARHQGDA